MNTTNVHITVDIEFSAGGYWDDPERFRPVGSQHVDLNIDGRSHGLGFILETLVDNGVTGTFFVETAQACYFGHEPMGNIARRIADFGQDVQLHIHPMWRSFKQPEDGRFERRPGSMLQYSQQEQVEILVEGVECMQGWGLPRPRVVRAGNLQANIDLYRAMAELSLPVSSHLGCAIFEPSEPALLLYSGRHLVEGILELPVLAFTDFRSNSHKHLRNLTITGCTFAETRDILEKARCAGVSDVVILTHAHEFAKSRDPQDSVLRPNRINQRRLSELCRYLAMHRDRFATPGLGSVSIRETERNHFNPGDNELLHGSALRGTQRLIVNFLNDTIWRL